MKTNQHPINSFTGTRQKLVIRKEEGNRTKTYQNWRGEQDKNLLSEWKRGTRQKLVIRIEEENKTKTCYQNWRGEQDKNLLSEWKRWTRQKLIRMEDKFAVTLTEDQFTPCNLEGQLHVPEKRGPGYPLCGPHRRSHEGAEKMSTPAEIHLLMTSISWPSVYSYDHTNWQFTNNTSIRQTLV